MGISQTINQKMIPIAWGVAVYSETIGVLTLRKSEGITSAQMTSTLDVIVTLSKPMDSTNYGVMLSGCGSNAGFVDSTSYNIVTTTTFRIRIDTRYGTPTELVFMVYP